MRGLIGTAISIVIPVFNEADNVRPLAAEVQQVLAAEALDWECIWVDDGSTDGTPEELTALAFEDHRHRLVALDHNQGQSAALAAGFACASMPLVATLDGDGQNDPADVPRMVRTLVERDLDVVNGYRVHRYRWHRGIASRIANGFRNRMTGESVRDVGCSTRVMRTELLRDLPVFRGMHRFLPTLIRLNGGGRQTEIPVAHRPRRAGHTKYGIWDRLGVGIADTFGVRWWTRRAVRPAVARVVGGRARAETAAPGPAVPSVLAGDLFTASGSRGNGTQGTGAEGGRSGAIEPADHGNTGSGSAAKRA
jgi:dolichol-phosphate mannosyltransferase